MNGSRTKDTRAATRYTLLRIPIDRYGYTRSGRYYGVGPPLFAYESEDGETSGEIRARDRADAKQKIRSAIRDPRARFTR